MTAIWAHVDVWALAETFGRNRTNQKFELTGVELTKVYCMMYSNNDRHTEIIWN